MGLRHAVLAVAALGTAATAWAGEPRTLAGAGPALALQVAPPGPREAFAVPPSLVAGLLATRSEETVRVTDWPVAPGERQTVELTRHEVYAPGARIVAIGKAGRKEVERSRTAFFGGTVVGDPSRRALLSVDPDRRELGGLGLTPDGLFELRASARPGEYEIAAPVPAPDAADAAEAGGFSCGGSPRRPEGGSLPVLRPAGAALSTLASLHTATVAVDTDNELMALKFSDSTAAATAYLASLVAALNVVYERDLYVRLLQGHTILRLSSAPDPWAQPACPAWPATCQSGSASSAQLTELSAYWNANYGSVPRAVTLMLSGKQSSATSSSGIAWLDGLCSAYYGNGFAQVFKYSGSTAASDARLVAHEIGHNFGASHTHCYPTATGPIDTCYSGEGGCYGGPTSCPAASTIDPLNGGPVANVQGTLMSYCHRLPGCPVTSIFHPLSVGEIGPVIDAGVNVCVFSNAGGTTPLVSAVTPASGPAAGGTTVTVDGTGFASGATVSFVDATRAAPAASVTFVSSTRLRAVTPAHAAGLTDVVVGNPERRTATRPGGFSFLPDGSGGLGFYTLAPCRAVDTRSGDGPAVAAGATRTFAVAGKCGVPADAKAVSLNVTVVPGGAAGNLVVFPGDLATPGTATVNFAAGQTRANNLIVGLATSGAGSVGVTNRSGAAAHVVVDLNGHFR